MTKRRARVIPTDALIEWALEHYPTEVITETVTTHRLRDSLIKLIKNATERAGEPCGPGGELDVPGVSLADGYLSIRTAEDSEQNVAYLWRQGRLNDVIDVKKMLED